MPQSNSILLRASALQTVAAFVFGALSTASAVAASNCSALSAHAGQVTLAVARRINQDGFGDFRRHGWDIGTVWGRSTSPFLNAATRFVLREGSSAPPSTDEAQSIREITCEIGGGNKAALNIGIWANDSRVNLDSDALSRLRSAMGYELHVVHWDMHAKPQEQEGTEPAPVDALMKEWVRAHDQSGLLGTEVGDLPTLMNARDNHDRVDHPLNILTALSIKGTFAADLSNGWRYFDTYPLYENVTMRGLRLDTKDAKYSLFLFVGDRVALENLADSIDVPKWEALKGDFHDGRSFLYNATFETVFPGAFDPRVSSGFGTYVRSFNGVSLPALSNLSLAIIGNGFNLMAFDAVEGVVTPRSGIFNVDGGGSTHPMMSLVQPVLYLLESRRSGTLLDIGFYDPRPCNASATCSSAR